MQSFSIKNDLSIISNYESDSKTKNTEPSNEPLDSNKKLQPTGFSKIVFDIEKYSSKCQENEKIEKIISLAYDPIKIAAFLFVNIISMFSLTFLLVLYPKLKLNFFYTQVSLGQAKLIAIFSKTNNIYIVPLQKNYNNQYIFSFMNFTYIFSEKYNTFISTDYNVNLNFEFLTDIQVFNMQNSHQAPEILFHKSEYIISQLTDIFYPYLCYSSFLFILNNNYILGYVLLVSVLASFSINCKAEKENISSLNKIINNDHSDIIVYRKDFNGSLYQKKITSLHLVIGDMYEIPNEGKLIPYNTKLLNGSLIIKIKEDISLVGGNSILPKGAKILQKRNESNNNNKIIGIIMDYYQNKKKNGLINEYLFPDEKNNGIYQFKMNKIIISVLFIFSICLFVYTIIFGYNYSYNNVYNENKVTFYSPLIFAMIGIGIKINSRKRVKNTKKLSETKKENKTFQENTYLIHSILPTKINSLSNNDYIFGDCEKNISSLSQKVFDYYKSKTINKNIKNKNQELEQFFIENLSTCHYITSINQNLISNDQIDLTLFKSTNWSLYEPQPLNDIKCNYDSLISTYVKPKQEKDLQEKLDYFNLKNVKQEKQFEEIYEEDTEESILKHHYELGVVRHFHKDIDNSLLTVIVRNVNEEFFKAYSKGSPEHIKKVCKKETIPNNYDEEIKRYEKENKKIIALSAKMMKMNYIQSQQVKRDFVEKNMIFLGFVIVEKNKGSNKEVIL